VATEDGEGATCSYTSHSSEQALKVSANKCFMECQYYGATGILYDSDSFSVKYTGVKGDRKSFKFIPDRYVSSERGATSAEACMHECAVSDFCFGLMYAVKERGSACYIMFMLEEDDRTGITGLSYIKNSAGKRPGCTPEVCTSLCGGYSPSAGLVSTMTQIARPAALAALSGKLWTMSGLGQLMTIKTEVTFECSELWDRLGAEMGGWLKNAAWAKEEGSYPCWDTNEGILGEDDSVSLDMAEEHCKELACDFFIWSEVSGHAKYFRESLAGTLSLIPTVDKRAVYRPPRKELMLQVKDVALSQAGRDGAEMWNFYLAVKRGESKGASLLKQVVCAKSKAKHAEQMCCVRKVAKKTNPLDPTSFDLGAAKASLELL
jgi:hypothetical protein